METEVEREQLASIPTPDLVAQALAATDDDAYWNAVMELQRRGGKAEFDAASGLCSDTDPGKRALGVDILSQLGYRESSDQSERKYYVHSVDLLLDLLDREEHQDVLASVAYAFGHLDDTRAIPGLVRLRTHASESVRNGVAFGLGAYSSQADRRAIRALIHLSRDECADVRDWATFALATLVESNRREIRDALFERVADPDGGIRAEAFYGLAVRHDSRIVDGLIRELQSPGLSDDRPGSLIVGSAAEIAEPRLYPLLLGLRDRYPVDETGREALEDAIERCRPRPVSAD